MQEVSVDLKDFLSSTCTLQEVHIFTCFRTGMKRLQCWLTGVQETNYNQVLSNTCTVLGLHLHLYWAHKWCVFEQRLHKCSPVNENHCTTITTNETSLSLWSPTLNILNSGNSSWNYAKISKANTTFGTFLQLNHKKTEHQGTVQYFGRLQRRWS